MVAFAYIYAMPGYKKQEHHSVTTELAEFHVVAVDYAKLETAADVAAKLVSEHGVQMIELCGGLANAETVSLVKQAVGKNVAVGQVMYGPEYRKVLVDLLNIK
jgi:hypothetical protein